MIVIQATCVGIRRWERKDKNKRFVTFEWKHPEDGYNTYATLDVEDEEGEFKIGDRVELRITQLVEH